MPVGGPQLPPASRNDVEYGDNPRYAMFQGFREPADRVEAELHNQFAWKRCYDRKGLAYEKRCCRLAPEKRKAVPVLARPAMAQIMRCGDGRGGNIRSAAGHSFRDGNG